jgi:putative endopeptidase
MNLKFSDLTRIRSILATGAVILSVSANAQKPGINVANMDTSVDPRTDFYTYCNGKWQKTFVLPESDARYGSFNEINENNLKKLKVIYETVGKNKAAAPNTDAQRLRDFYNTAMDSVKADQLGVAPIKAQMNMIDSVKNANEFIALKSKFEFLGVDFFFSSSVSADLKNSRKNRFGIIQGGYGLGDRDYYHNAQHEKIREEYKRYLQQLFVLAGVEQSLAMEHAKMILDFETRLTAPALTRVQMRDVEKLYNIYTPATLKELAPGINWEIYFAEKKIPIPDSINVATVDYIKSVSNILARAPIKALQVYAQAQLLMRAAPFLNERMNKVNFAFHGRTMSGSRVMKARWQRVHNVINGSIGEIVSKEFVKKHFPATSKQKVDKLIDNLILAYRDRIATRDWMTDDTKKQANRKLDLLIRKIGYPDKWKNYAGLTIGTESYWDNMCRVTTWLTQDNLNDLKKPVDRYKWQMTPITVNAYYDPTTNEITFPAAILQPPFFDPEAEDAANYGTMGSIIGHELTHGFDDQGSQFDADGNMKMWWTDDDYKNFKERTGLIVKQFDGYVAIDTLRVNGSMTQGENIADLGGLTMAYYAYKKSLGNNKSKVIAGFTGEQRFFIAWAQGWKSMTRDQELKRLLTLDYHSPAYFRAYAPLTNMKEFHEAFGVKPGDKMHRADNERVEIW